MNLVNFIWAFTFSPVKDETGASPLPDVSCNAFTEVCCYLLERKGTCSMIASKGVNATPLRFQCKIEPRSEEKAAAIRHHYLEQADILRPFEQHISDSDKVFVEASRSPLMA
jgi:hypothetical protein